jgi:putative transposase
MMLLQDVEQLILPGYSSLETGYRRLSNGQYCVAAIGQVADYKSKWVDWLYGYLTKDTKSYISSAPKIHVYGEWDDNWKPGHYIGASHYIQEYLAGSLMKFRIQYQDPAKYFDISKLNEFNIGTVVCAESFLNNDIPHGSFIHVVRDTDWGFEIRSRYWLYNSSEDLAKAMLRNCIDSHFSLNRLLRELANKLPVYVNQTSVKCKFCNSTEVVKNGQRKNIQLYLCKNCGHSFIDNNALPGMKYPVELVASAVRDYYSGKSLIGIRRNIEDSTSILPSNSTIYTWINRATKKALFDAKKYKPQVGNRWVLHQTDIQHSPLNNDEIYSLITIEDFDTHYFLGSKISFNNTNMDVCALIKNAIEAAGKLPEQLLISYENTDFIFDALDIEANMKNIQIITELDINSSQRAEGLRLHNILANRLKLMNPANNIENIQSILEGFIFHFNYLMPNDLLDGKTPAEAAGIQTSYRDWMDFIY